MSAAVTHSPDDLHIMAIDFTGRGLARIGALPHCGAVASRNEALAARIARHVLDEVGVRRSELAREGVGTLAEYGQRTGRTFPHLLVLVAGGERLSSVGNHDDVSAAAPALTSVIAEGAGLGVQVIAAGLPGFGVHRPGSYIDHRIVLTAADTGDYLGMGCPRALLGELGGPRRAIDVRTAAPVQFCSLAGGEVNEADAFDALAYRLRATWLAEALTRPPKIIREVMWPTPLSAVAGALGPPPDRAREPLPVALGEHTGDTAWVDAVDVGRSMFVAGGRRTGKSNALLALGLLARQRGWVVVATAGFDKSPFFDTGCPLDVVALADVPGRVDPTRPTVVLIDDVDRIDAASASLPEEFGPAALFVVSGQPSWFQGPQRLLTERGIPRIDAVGLLLAPGSFGDVSLLNLPAERAREAAAAPKRAGQGLLADGSGDVIDVIVPLVAPTDQASAPLNEEATRR